MPIIMIHMIHHTPRLRLCEEVRREPACPEASGQHAAGLTAHTAGKVSYAIIMLLSYAICHMPYLSFNAIILCHICITVF
jgi:hypothetical protein